VAISVVQIGHNEINGVGTTIAVTVPAAGVPVGKRVIVAFNCNGGSSDPDPTCSDSKGNTYVRDEYNSGATRQLAIFSAPVTTALVSGDTITITHVSTARRLVTAAHANVAAKDVSSNNGGTGTTSITSGATATRSQASSLGIGAFGFSSSVTTQTLTPAAGWSNLSGLQQAGTGTSWWYLATTSRIYSSVGTDSADATLNSGQPYGALDVVYPELIPSVSQGGTVMGGNTETVIRVTGGRTVTATLTNAKWIN
jgi:hypothetical protein